MHLQDAGPLPVMQRLGGSRKSVKFRSIDDVTDDQEKNAGVLEMMIILVGKLWI